MKTINTLNEPEIRTIPEGWENFELEKFADITKDGYSPNGVHSLPYIGLEHIDQQTLSLNSIGKSSDVTSNKFRFRSGDILFGKLRPYFRKVYRPDFSGICSTDIWVVRAKEGFDQGWLFYLFTSEDFVNSASGGSGGTRMPRADWNYLKDTIWPVPKLPEQKRISEILSSLDDKIELNRKINANLEKLAATLFKKWFVGIGDELPEGWGMAKLGEFLDLSGGLAYDGSKISDEGVPMITLGTISTKEKFNFDGLKYYSGDFGDQHKVKPEDLIIATRDVTQKREIIGSPLLVPNLGRDVIVATNLYKVINKSVINNLFFYYLLRTQKYREQIIAAMKGSTVVMITKDAILDFEFYLPTAESINHFIEIAKNVSDLIYTNEDENKNLSKIRDSLLPRLMSGKIRVKI